MKQHVEAVTQKLLSKIPHQDKSLLISELSDYSVPEFIIKAIKQVASEKLSATVKPPKTPWADLDSSKAEQAWTRYTETLENSLQIPADQVEKTVSESVKLSLNLAVKPLRTIPKTIFKSENKLELSVIRSRGSRIYIHKHLVSGLVRYMEKRSIETISVEKAGEIIKKIDKKLTESFNALHWAEYTGPIFDIAGPDVDSELFRQFFEDRGEKRTARKFENMEGTVDESNFVVVLSSSDLLDTTGYEEEQPSLFTPGDDNETEVEETVESDQKKSVETEGESQAQEGSVEAETEPWDDDEQEPEKTFADEFVAQDEEDDEDSGEDKKEHGKSTALADQFNDEIDFLSDEDTKPKEASGDVDDNTTAEPERTSEALDSDPQEKSEVASQKKQELEEDQQEDKEDGFVLDPDKITISEEYSYFGTNVTDDEEDERIEDEDSPLHSKFVFDEDNAGEDEENEDPSTIYDEMDLVREGSNEIDEKKSVLSLFEPVEDEETEPRNVADETEEDAEDSEPKEPQENIAEAVKQESEDAEKEEEKPVSKDEIEDMPEPEEERQDERKISGFLSEEIDEAEETDDVPMWKSFLEQEDMDEDEPDEPEPKPATSEYFDEETDDIEEGFIDEPIIDLTKDTDTGDEKIEMIEEWLSDDRQRFVSSIFSGSDMAYESALSEIVDFDSWKSAYQYIEKEIFARNMVDIYDEDAVDFTDRLQNYFEKNKS